MSWRTDWCLLATGLISYGITMIQKSRGEVLHLIANEGERIEGFLMGASGLLIPILLLSAFALRLFWRVVTWTWK